MLTGDVFEIRLQRRALIPGDPTASLVMRTVHRIAAYLWASPSTLLGMLALPPTLLTGGRAQVVRGAVEISGGFTTWLLRRCPFYAPAAMTLGHVILGRDPDCLQQTRDHEHVHVRQYERWGPFMLPVYLSASLLLWLRGKDPYFDNPFEREAYGLTGGDE